jgi:Domain of unknown function (DUF4383)
VVSIPHNIVHCSESPASLWRTAAQARNYLVFGGAIYLALFLYGLIVGQKSAANFVPVNTARSRAHAGSYGGRRRHQLRTPVV